LSKFSFCKCPKQTSTTSKKKFGHKQQQKNATQNHNKLQDLRERERERERCWVPESYPRCKEVCDVCGSRRFGWDGYTVGAARELPPGSLARMFGWPWLTEGPALAMASAIPLASAS
jgi:hypothetical protein